MLTIGCHLSTEKGFLHMAQEAVSIHANTFQYFTRNPRGGAVRAIDKKDVDAYLSFAKEHGIERIMGYAPYTVEPASSRQATQDFTLMVMSEDLERLEMIPGQYYLVRPGSNTAGTVQEGIENVISALNKTLTPSMSTRVLIDTMSGEGHEVGSTFDQLAEILSRIDRKDKVGVCVDASALWAAGYNIKDDLSGVLDEFDEKIGLDHLIAIHLNDSAEPLGSKVNRHARIGEGKIGFKALSNMTRDPRLVDKAFYLEEYDSTLVVYEHDIAHFRDAYAGVTASV